MMPADRSESSTVLSLVFGAAALLVGAGLAFYLFPSAMLFDRWSWWATDTGDNPIGVIGYLYLAQDSWRWPLTYTRLLNPPEGMNAFYTDMVPIGALIGKIFYAVTGRFQLFFGHWILFAYAMQGFLSWLIFRHLGLARIVALLGAALILLTPAFTARVGHIGLIAHWVVLLAILFYVRAISVVVRGELNAWALGLGSVAAINPYLLAMCAAVFLAGVGEAVRRQRIHARDGAIAVALVGLTGLAWALALGIVGQGSLPEDAGFGSYSMNLLSPVIPQVSAIPGFAGLIDATGGQYEGFNYLGAGMLSIIAIVLVLRFRDVAKLIATNPILSVILVMMTAYAVSDKVYLGNWYLGDLGYSDWPGLHKLTSVLRSSGRFFWPVGYCLAIGAVLILSRRFSSLATIVVLISAVAAQWADIQPLVAMTRTLWNVKPPLIDHAAFTEASRRYAEFTIYPPSRCLGMADRDVLVQLQLIAARARIPASGAFTNRGGPDCGEAAMRLSENLASAASTSNPLVILHKSASNSGLLIGKAARGFACRETPNLIVCSRRPDEPSFVALGPVLSPAPIPLDEPLSVARNGAGATFLGLGWSVADDKIRWAMGPTLTIAGPLEKPLCNNVAFSALVQPLSFGPYMVRTARVTINDRDVGAITFDGPAQQEIRHEISLDGVCIETITLGLHFTGLRSPNELGMNPDIRPLSLLFQWFKITGN